MGNCCCCGDEGYELTETQIDQDREGRASTREIEMTNLLSMVNRRWLRSSETSDTRNGNPPPNLPILVPEITLDELKEITNNFGSDARLGNGSFAKVYRGIKNGKEVVIKKLNECSQSDEEFRTQVAIASALKHPNITELLGYCIIGKTRYLAYEYATNGSLHNLLHGARNPSDPMPGLVLSWNQRLQIAAEAARGLEYLHELIQISHRNIKSSKIMIFSDLKAKIGDYELTDHWKRRRIVGGQGYSAPECAIAGKSLKKSDVYSFGVVLLELLTGRKIFDMERSGQQRNLVTWAVPLLRTNIKECVDPKLHDNYSLPKAELFGKIASLCLQYDTDFRPNMTTVRREIERLLEEQIETSSGRSSRFMEEVIL